MSEFGGQDDIRGEDGLAPRDAPHRDPSPDDRERDNDADQGKQTQHKATHGDSFHWWIEYAVDLAPLRFPRREAAIGGTDCGFDTFIRFSQVDPDVAWLKLQSLAQGAEIASGEL